MTDLVIRGAGGGKSGGGGGGISEDPDTLSSVAYARFIEVIGEGEIKGLVNNEYSIYLDGVPLRDLQGTPNYKPFRWFQRQGTQAQGVIPGFVGTQQENAVSLKIMKSQGKIIRDIGDAGADAVRVTVAVNGLSFTSSNGKVTGTYVDYELSARVSAGSWRVMYRGRIDGKTRSHYQRSHELALSSLGPGPYEVSIERLTDDSTSALLVNDLYWDSYTVINYEKFAYPNSALIALELDARYFNQIPQRSYHVRGLIVQVPMNYDPVGRTYATTGAGTTNGVWNGTFKTAYTNNPAWCYYDIVTNRRYGLGKRISASQIDKWEVYEIARYCDGLVPTGNSSNVFELTSSSNYSTSGQVRAGVPVANQPLEPRFTLNCVINTRAEAHKVLEQLTSVFRGMAYWSHNSVMLTQDRPTDATMLFTNANVENGLFNYEGSSRHQRNTVVLVGWNDPSEDFRQKWEYIEDRDGIARYGLRQDQMVAFGCTSKSQARRVGLWYLYTQRMEHDAVSFTAGLDASYVKPGDVGKIMDSHRAGARWGGRVLGSTTSIVSLDGTVTLTAGSYTLSVMAQDGSVTEKTVNIGTSGQYTQLTVSIAYSTAPAKMAIWTLSSNTVTPMQARVISVRQSGINTHEIVALEHNPSKYAAIELGTGVLPTNYSFLSYDSVPAVTGLIAFEDSFRVSTTSAVTTNIDVSWFLAANPLVRGYMVKAGSDSVYLDMPETRDPYMTIKGVQPGTYVVSVSVVNQLGIVGPASSVTLLVTGVDSKPPPNVTGFDYTLDVANGLKLLWDSVIDYIDMYEIRRGGVWETATLVDRVKATSKILGAVGAGEHIFLIKAIDTSGNYSTGATSLLVVVPGALAPTVTHKIVGPDEFITWNVPPSPFTIDRYVIRVGDTLATATVVDTIKSTGYRRKVDYAGARTYWVSAIDIIGNEGAAGAVSVFISIPGEIISGRAEVIDNNVLLRWTPPSTGSLPVESYDVRKGPDWATGLLVGSNGNSTFAVVFEQQSGSYIYWIVAVDTAGNRGNPVGIPATVNQPPDYVLRVNIDSKFDGAKDSMYTEGGKIVEEHVIIGSGLRARSSSWGNSSIGSAVVGGSSTTPGILSIVLVTEGGHLLGPVNTTETWSEHFQTHGWTSPQDQVDAGLPLYINPSVASGTYEEVFDYGALLPGTTITATLGYEVIQGSVGVSGRISYKTALADPWIDAPVDAFSILASNFRYVKVVWTFTTIPGPNLIRVTSFNMKLSSKLRTDSGRATITDANAGIFVPFNVDFVDTDTPIVQPEGEVPLIPVSSFADVGNPTGFTVYLYTRDGVKTTGSFSWTARGF